jgi:hypothetical protein
MRSRLLPEMGLMGGHIPLADHTPFLAIPLPGDLVFPHRDGRTQILFRDLLQRRKVHEPAHILTNYTVCQ